MKKSIYLIVCLILFFIFYNKSLFAEESMLTIKQQLDRLQREVNDLSKSVFKILINQMKILQIIMIVKQ